MDTKNPRKRPIRDEPKMVPFAIWAIKAWMRMGPMYVAVWF